MLTPAGFLIIKHKATLAVTAAQPKLQLCDELDVLKAEPRLDEYSDEMISAGLGFRFVISTTARGAYSRLSFSRQQTFSDLYWEDEMQDVLGRSVRFPRGIKAWHLTPAERFSWALTLRYISVPDASTCLISLFRDYVVQLEDAIESIARIVETHDDNGDLIVPAPPVQLLPAHALTVDAGGQGGLVAPGAGVQFTPPDDVLKPNTGPVAPQEKSSHFQELGQPPSTVTNVAPVLPAAGALLPSVAEEGATSADALVWQARDQLAASADGGDEGNDEGNDEDIVPPTAWQVEDTEPASLRMTAAFLALFDEATAPDADENARVRRVAPLFMDWLNAAQRRPWTAQA